MTDLDRWADALDPNCDVPPGRGPSVRQVAADLADPATWEGPSRSVRENVLVAAAQMKSDRDAVGAPPPIDLAERRITRRLTPAIAAAVAVAAVFAAIVLWPGAVGTKAELVAASDPTVVVGSAVVASTGSGVSIELTVDALPPAEPGTYYAAWLVGDGPMVPIGSFHARETTDGIVLWSGVELSPRTMLMITMQSVAEPPAPSDVVVARALLSE